jgi:hypothetical protein
MSVRNAKSLFFLHEGRDWTGTVPEIGAAGNICAYGGGRNRGNKTPKCGAS